jgi:hypothetical protein
LWFGEWGLGSGPKPQSPIPNPQSPIPNPQSPIPKIRINHVNQVNNKFKKSIKNKRLNEKSKIK